MFFFGGFYQDQENQTLENIKSSQNWPFFVLLVLLVIEKFCTEWLHDKFGTQEDIIQQYKEVEKDYHELKAKIDEMKKPKKVETPKNGESIVF